MKTQFPRPTFERLQNGRSKPQPLKRRSDTHTKDLRNPTATRQQSAHGNDVTVGHSDQKLSAYVEITTLDVVEVTEVVVILKRFSARSRGSMKPPHIRSIGEFKATENKLGGQEP